MLSWLPKGQGPQAEALLWRPSCTFCADPPCLTPAGAHLGPRLCQATVSSDIGIESGLCTLHPWARRAGVSLRLAGRWGGVEAGAALDTREQVM